MTLKNDAGKTLNLWKNVLTKPTLRTFSNERNNPTATLSNALKWVLAAALTAFLLGSFRGYLIGNWVIHPANLPQEELPTPQIIRGLTTLFIDRLVSLHILRRNLVETYAEFWLTINPFREFISNLIVVRLYRFGTSTTHWQRNLAQAFLSPLYFVIHSAIYHAAARLFGGKGKFGRFAFLIASYGAPIAIAKEVLYYLPLAIAGLLALQPQSSIESTSYYYYFARTIINTTITYSAAAYWLSLTYLATRAEHETGWLRPAIAVICATPIALFLRTIVPDTISALYLAARLGQ